MAFWDVHPYDHPYDYWGYEEYWSEGDDELLGNDFFRVGIARVPLTIMADIAAVLEGSQVSRQQGTMAGKLPRAWMCALAQKFPDTSVDEVRSRYPCLVPQWLLQEFESFQVWTYTERSFANDQLQNKVGA
jgi:hypothetical protein